MPAYPVFTVAIGSQQPVEKGAEVAFLEVGKESEGHGPEIPVLKVGERGVGRALGVIPVVLLPRKQEDRDITIYAAALDYSRGRLRLIEAQAPNDNSHAIVVFRTGIGYRGGNRHEFPQGCQTLARGVIAQGAAGRMGSGEQYIVLLPKNARVLVKRSGRLYGSPPAHYVWFDGQKMHVATPDEAELLALID